MKRPFCLLLTGKPNSGKSTIAYALVQKRLRNCLIIDGDKHRDMQFLGYLGFTKEDILKNNEHVIKLAQFAQEQDFNVIISQIAPYVEQRENMKKALQGFHEVYLECDRNERAQRPNYTETELEYEHGKPELVLNTGYLSIGNCVNEILEI